jgi:BMFP domain-containing protein YqiC
MDSLRELQAQNAALLKRLAALEAKAAEPKEDGKKK